jgi:polysaccharide export outer membrane protein
MHTGGKAPSLFVESLLIVALMLLPAVTPAGETHYRIGPDDVLAITVWDNKDLDQVVFVRPDGKISLPLLGEVEAGGLTVEELGNRLTELYTKTVKGAQVTVGVREIRNRVVFFVGGVVKPGPVPLTHGMTLLQAISQAGGLAPTADLESAFVLRTREQIPVDLVRLIQRGQVDQNIVLQPGDTIVLPVADVVYVHGEVKSPGLFKFSKTLTILQVIAQAGGFTPMASPRRVSLLRQNGSKVDKVNINVNDMMSNSGGDMPLKPNDIVVVPQRLF